MKIIRLLAASVLVVALAPALTASAGKGRTFEISFNGYCDGMRLTFPSAGLGTPGTVDGLQTGCASDELFGQSSGKSFASGTTYVKARHDIAMNAIRNLKALDSDDPAHGTWVRYGLDGTRLVLLNSGTWTEGPPPRGAGVASFEVHQVQPDAAPVTKAIKEISLDGYCDGMHFNIPSEGLGTPGTIDGVRTGCAADGLMGEQGKVKGAGKGNVVSFDADGVLPLQAGVFNDHTWVLYSSEGGSIYVANSGTWTKGTPPPSSAGLKPAF